MTEADVWAAAVAGGEGRCHLSSMPPPSSSSLFRGVLFDFVLFVVVVVAIIPSSLLLIIPLLPLSPQLLMSPSPSPTSYRLSHHWLPSHATI